MEGGPLVAFQPGPNDEKEEKRRRKIRRRALERNVMVSYDGVRQQQDID